MLAMRLSVEPGFPLAQISDSVVHSVVHWGHRRPANSAFARASNLIKPQPPAIRAVAALRAHAGAVTSLDFGTNGLELCSGDDEGWAVWWNLETRRPIAIWRAHALAIISVNFLPEEPESDDAAPLPPRLLLTQGRDNKLRVWRLDRGGRYATDPLAAGAQETTEHIKPWLVHAQDVNALTFCMAALAGRGDGVRVAVPSTLSAERIDVYTLRPFARPFQGLVPSENDLIDEMTESDYEINDAGSDADARSKLGTVMALLFVESREMLLAAYESGHLAAFDTGSGALRWLTRAHRHPILSLALEPGDAAVLSAAVDKSLVRTSLDAHLEHDVTRLGVRGTAAVRTSAELGLAITTGWDRHVRLWRTGGTLVLAGDFELAAGPVLADLSVVVGSPRRRLRQLPAAWLAVAAKDARIYLYGLDTNILDGEK